MARIGITQAQALERIAATLQAELLLDPRRCYLTVEPLVPPKMPPADWWVSVSPGASSFPEDLQIGSAGQAQITENMTVDVTIYSRIRTDSTDHDQYLLLDPERGLLSLKRKIIEALAQADLEDAQGEKFLRQFLLPINSSRPYFDGQHGVGWMTVGFLVSYDWV